MVRTVTAEVSSDDLQPEPGEEAEDHLLEAGEAVGRPTEMMEAVDLHAEAREVSVVGHVQATNELVVRLEESVRVLLGALMVRPAGLC